MIRPLLTLVMVAALMAGARSFLPEGAADLAGHGVTLGFGFLLVAALLAGRVVAPLGLPRLTGYLACGVLFGPDLLGLVTRPMVASLRLINGVAIGLIALTAGGELDLRRLRPRMRVIAWITAVSFTCTALAGAAVARILPLPFLAGEPASTRWLAVAALGVLVASLSPAVVLALLDETASAGPVSETSLGVVVLSDLVVIVVFTALQAAGSEGSPTAGWNPTGATLIAMELLGSVAVGAAVAVAVAGWQRYVGRHLALVLLAVCVVAAEVGSRIYLDPLVICLTAGVLLENVLGLRGHEIARSLAPASLPVYAVFFALAGAQLALGALGRLWPFAIALVAARTVALMASARLAARFVGAEASVVSWVPVVLIPQAGVSIGLAALLARAFPRWGPAAQTLMLAVVTINQVVGPLLARYALKRADEIGRRVAPQVVAPG